MIERVLIIRIREYLELKIKSEDFKKLKWTI